MEETKFGKCPWCEKHNQVLHFALGSYDNKLWCGWICAKCLDAARNNFKDEIKEEK